MQFLFNTIMLEINRWTEHHTLTFPLIDLLKPLKIAQFDELEIWQYHISSLTDKEVKILAEKLQELDMSVPVIGMYVQLHLKNSAADEMNRLVTHMTSSATILGSRMIKISPGSLASKGMDLPTWKLSIARLKELATKLADKGMLLSMETHSNSLCDTEESVLRLMNDLSGLDNVGICYQPFDEQNTEQAMKTFSNLYPYVIHIHLQNLPSGDAETTTFLETGGWMDYTKLLPHIKKSGYDGIFSLEFTEGIFPPEGEEFNPQTVIHNAVTDREFFLKWWEAE